MDAVGESNFDFPGGRRTRRRRRSRSQLHELRRRRRTQPTTPSLEAAQGNALLLTERPGARSARPPRAQDRRPLRSPPSLPARTAPRHRTLLLANSPGTPATEHSYWNPAGRGRTPLLDRLRCNNFKSIQTSCRIIASPSVRAAPRSRAAGKPTHVRSAPTERPTRQGGQLFVVHLGLLFHVR